MQLPSLLRPDIGSIPFVRDLAMHGERPALITTQGELTYRELAARVADAARRLGPARRLVLLAGANRPEALVYYLAALSAGHPLLLVPGANEEALRSLVEAYEPDVILRPDAAGSWALEEQRAVSSHTFHPDLALLLSTSGSTGSPKLVRLSHENLQSNAASIAAYLGIRPTDRAATTLPMHYCYGLSVINSHLLSGAGLILTELSVADACFWELFRGSRGSTFAGVPYTFDLLDRVGFDAMQLPQLRYVTQAGGRLAPERVARYAALGQERGWDLFVMYGQTEATARMAYLPPDLAVSQPQAIGIPIPGGSFRLEPLPGEAHLPAGTGELLYSGANVMLGYAETPADLALGRTVQELRTGDLARRTPEGLYEVVGRRSRFAKIVGLRIDPQRVEAMLEGHGVSASCTGGENELIVAVAGTEGTTGDGAYSARRIRRLVAGDCALPPRAIRVLNLRELPRLASGKPDYAALRRLAREQAAEPEFLPAGLPLCRLYAEILDRPLPEVTEDSSFVSLGGDSLCYVEMSIRLEESLGRLPESWHTLPIRELARPAPTAEPAAAGRPRLRALETSIVLRAIAIILIAGTHMELFTIKGGAHILLGAAGFNFARFHLTSAGRRRRIRHIGSSIARIALPSAAWITAAMLLVGEYHLPHPFLLSSILGPFGDRTDLHFWFLEALVYFLLALAALLSIPALDRAERRFPFAFPIALATLALSTRYDLIGLDARIPHLTPVVVFWLFALGWAAAKATHAGQRALVTVAVAATIPGLFPYVQPGRELMIIAGFALLIWVPSLPSLPQINKIVGVLAGASLYIYLTHYTVYPYFDWPVLGLLASLAVGIAYGSLVNRVMRRLRSLTALPVRRAPRAGR